MADGVWIVIVNYRTADLVVDCLRSLAAQIGGLPEVRTVVVDNASGDGSTEKLQTAIDRERWHDWVTLVAAGRNGGFSYGNNVGIRVALQSSRPVDYIMLLNPDTIVHEGAIRTLIDFMEAHRDVGIAGSMLEDADGVSESSAHTAFSPLGELEAAARLGPLSRLLHRYAVTGPPRTTAHECDWISGASLFARRAVIDQIGLMDEGFFLYFEEVDFCTRARKAGWKIWFVPDSRVVHLEGAATGIRNVARRRPGYWYDSRRRYFVKHCGVAGLILADVLWAVGRLSFVLRRALRLGAGGDRADPKWLAFDLLWGDLRALVTGRLFALQGEADPR